jgi:hypothetical protein
MHILFPHICGRADFREPTNLVVKTTSPRKNERMDITIEWTPTIHRKSIEIDVTSAHITMESLDQCCDDDFGSPGSPSLGISPVFSSPLQEFSPASPMPSPTMTLNPSTVDLGFSDLINASQNVHPSNEIEPELLETPAIGGPEMGTGIQQPNRDCRAKPRMTGHWWKQCRMDIDAFMRWNPRHRYQEAVVIEYFSSKWFVSEHQVRTYFTNLRMRIGSSNPELKRFWASYGPYG